MAKSRKSAKHDLMADGDDQQCSFLEGTIHVSPVSRNVCIVFGQKKILKWISANVGTLINLYFAQLGEM